MDNQKIQFKTVGIYAHQKPEKHRVEATFLKKLLKFLRDQNAEVFGDANVQALLTAPIPRINDEKKYDLKIGIGGDGTLLKMMRTLQKDDGLLLGINFGTLGFLSELTPETALEKLAQIFDRQFHIDERMLLKAFVWRKNSRGEPEKVFRSYGLNEIVFGHGGLARITNFNVKVDRRVLTTYRSDGLIFSTPTGSTAYALSAGGPIIYPRVFSILVTPVAPHTFSHRPILLPPTKNVQLNFLGRLHSISMTIDGQIHFSLNPSDQVTIQKATRTAKFIRLKESHYFRTIRNKLGWGGNW